MEILVTGIILLTVLGFWFASIYENYDGMEQYNNSRICDGSVVSSLGTRTVNSYGRFSTLTYEEYDVEYDYKGEKLRATVLSHHLNLQPGDYLEVHINDRNGHHVICSDTYGRKISDLVDNVAVVGIIVVFVILSFFFFLYIIKPLSHIKIMG